MKKLLVSIAASLACCAAATREITVLSGGAIEPGLHSAAQALEKERGHKVRLTFNTAPVIARRIAGGDVFDVLISPPAVIEQVAKLGKVSPDPRVDVGKVGLGIAVHPGAPVPDISSVDAIQRAVLEADSLTFNQASTGIYFENLLKKWGLYERVEPKTTRYPDGASVLEHTLKGTGREIAFAAITEILLFKDKGLRFIGPLPAEVQNYTSYIAVPMTDSKNADIARAFVTFMGTPAGKKVFVAAGIE